MEKVVRDAIKEVGYDDEKKGMDFRKACVIIHID
jgi:S-adenosylmethionine synthetase